SCPPSKGSSRSSTRSPASSCPGAATSIRRATATRCATRPTTTCRPRATSSSWRSRAALARRTLPMLCICRGMQLLNVALGGDLVQHIPDHFGERVLHRRPERLPVTHPVRLEPESRLAHLLGATELVVRSFHHQAVGRLGAGLRAVAWSPDGVVEAVESERHPFVVAVQWHPELDALGDAGPLRLFEALVARSRDYAARRSTAA